LISVLLLAGCTKQLLGGLEETAANEVVSALRLEGVEAEKSPVGDKAWRVLVPDAQLAEAVQIIERHNLPKPAFQGLGQVFKKDSLVSTPTEERARLIHAMSQELERSLAEIDGVLIARVHPVILPQDPLNPRRATASASVLIKYRPGADMSGRESMIRALVAAGIEGLSYDDVKVVMVPADARNGAQPPGESPVHRAVTANSSLPPMYAGVIVALLAALVLSFAAVHWRRRMARAAKRLHGRWSETVSGVLHAGARRTPGAGLSREGRST
jgi:type III secretion protein J